MVCLEAGEIVPFPKKKKFVNLSPCPTNHSLKIPTYCMCIPDVYNSVMSAQAGTMCVNVR